MPGAIRTARSTRRPVAPPPFVDVTVFDSLQASAATWDALAPEAHASPYQDRDWMQAWLDTEGALAGIQPMIVVATDAAQQATALLPLGVRRTGGLRIAGFLGGRHANYNLGLFAADRVWSEADLLRLLRRAARRLPGSLDIVELLNQPQRWHDRDNPLAALRHQPSPSFGHRQVLSRDGDALLGQSLSAATRKKMRSKLAYLEGLGAVTHIVARSPEAIAKVLAAHLEQKSVKLAETGLIAPADPLTELGRFYARAAAEDPEKPGALELHALRCGERLVATFGGLARDHHFSGVLISHEGEPRFARASPGELLLAEVIKQKCSEGFTGFDLGIGEARYKDGFCPIVDPMIDTLVPLTWAGTLVVGAERLRLRLKGAIKQSPHAWALAQGVRRGLGWLRRARVQG